MNKIIEINDADIGFRLNKSAVYGKWRKAARAVLMKGKLIALMHVSNKSYYKLPGGGLEKGEDIEEALIREIKEETGCSIGKINVIGETIEYRSQQPMKQISYCFMADVVSQGASNLEKGEVEDGFKLIWVKSQDAVKLLKNSKPKAYNGKFIIKRDLAIVVKALSFL